MSVLWNDPHIVLRSELPDDDVDSLIFGPTLTVGLLFKKTNDFVVIIHSLERSEIDEADYTVIFNNCIIAMKEYGSIELREIRQKGAS